jgi:putative protease
MNDAPPLRIPEILAPAGDDECLTAALNAGADAVYFGLAEGFNARARAANFTLESLPRTVERIHRHGARAYVTMNTLVFDAELPTVEAILRRLAAAGIDAILVQDPAVARLAVALEVPFERHASTQMTLSSPEGMALAKALGLSRVVLPRELTLEEIALLRRSTDLELEVFVHGALCMSWSGQCLTSEAWGGRSANRGQCAQSCRLPYDLVVDGETRDLGGVAHLLSPHDLAAWRVLPRLIELGIASLKIEGRQKGPAYVTTAVEAYRAARDRVVARALPAAPLLPRETVEAMAVSFSRGFSTGFFEGVDHQQLVDGTSPTHRGLRLGVVERVDGREVHLGREAEPPELKPGDGVVFEGNREAGTETGGPVFAVIERPDGRRLLRFGRPGPDLDRVRPGQVVWKTGDAALQRRVERQLREDGSIGRNGVAVTVSGAAGEPLVAAARSGPAATEARSSSNLAPASGSGLDAALLTAKLGRLGGTPWRLESLDTAHLAPGLHLPVSELNDLRRRLVEGLDEAWRAAESARRTVRLSPEGAVARLLESATRRVTPSGDTARLVPLCRTEAQLEAAIAAGCPEVELDWMELVGLERAVARARDAGLEVTIATVRVQKPGEEGYDRRLARLDPDGLLVRHWGALESFRAAGAEDRPAPELHGDFSLNVSNAVTANFLLSRGLADVTPAHDLDVVQLGRFLDRVDPSRVTVVLHHHIATFHTEHCVYAHLLSEGRDFRDCGRPCEEHAVALRDRTGDEHPVVVDVGCRNTVFNARAQTAARHVPLLLGRGVRRFRAEFVREGLEETREVLTAYRSLLDGTSPPEAVLRRVGALERFGVTSGTLRVLDPV